MGIGGDVQCREPQPTQADIGPYRTELQIEVQAHVARQRQRHFPRRLVPADPDASATTLGADPDAGPIVFVDGLEAVLIIL